MSVREMVPTLSLQRSANIDIVKVCLRWTLGCYSPLVLELVVCHSWRLGTSVAHLAHRHLVLITWVHHIDFSKIILELINRLFSILFNHIVVIILLTYHRGLQVEVLVAAVRIGMSMAERLLTSVVAEHGAVVDVSSTHVVLNLLHIWFTLSIVDLWEL